MSDKMEAISVLKGKVVHGKALGRTVGMPTANLLIIEGSLPDAGVYATRIRVGEESFLSVTNIGTRPTVDDDAYVTVEVHILDFERDIYGETVILEILRFLRPIQRFQNLQEVQAQVSKDIACARSLEKK
ncbi:MAG: riboflavin kinase [Faecalimonas sp.]|nr:riboflavin kinase [Faecalimonas sp.]